jgi:hypothetical protein
VNFWRVRSAWLAAARKEGKPISAPKDESGEARLLRADSAVETMRRGGRQRVRYVQLA